MKRKIHCVLYNIAVFFVDELQRLGERPEGRRVGVWALKRASFAPP